MPEWLSSGKSSFHLHIFLCNICLHDTPATFPPCTSYFLMSLFWFSITNKIFLLVRNFMLVSTNRKRTSLRIKNPNSCSLGRVAHAYLKLQKKQQQQQQRERVSRSILSCECGTNFTPRQASWKLSLCHKTNKQTKFKLLFTVYFNLFFTLRIFFLSTNTNYWFSLKSLSKCSTQSRR